MALTPHVASLSLVVLASRSVSWAALPVAVGAGALSRNIRIGGNSARPRAFPLAVDGREDVKQAHDACCYGVADDCTLARGHEASLLRKTETKTAVHDSEENDDAAKPDVAVRPDCACVVTLEEDVVQEAEQGLEDQQCEDNNANDGMSIVERVKVPRHPDTDAEGSSVEYQAEDLEQAMDPPETWEGCESDHDAANWEEESKSQRAKYGVSCDEDAAAVGDV